MRKIFLFAKLALISLAGAIVFYFFMISIGFIGSAFAEDKKQGEKVRCVETNTIDKNPCETHA